MFGYCGFDSKRSFAAGSSPTTRSAISRSSATCSASRSSSKSRTIARIRAVPAVPLDLVDVDEAFAAGGRLRGEAIGGQLGDDPRGEAGGVDQLPGGEARVDVDPLDRDDRLGAGEGLVLELADGRAVERVGAARAEGLDVEERGAEADLLVGREGDPQVRPRQLRVGGEVGDRGHDLGDPGLVVGAEQGVAAGGDDVLADLARPAAASPPGRGRSRRFGSSMTPPS